VAASRFVDHYRDALADLGQPAERSHELTGPLPTWLPRSLADLYRVTGRHPINHVHHRLFPPDELIRQDGKVVFAEENQQVVVWAFSNSDSTEDPQVWQGQPASEDTNDVTAWYREDETLSDFVVSMWKWIVAGESPPADPIT
jgi:hypothetical protein